MKRLQAATHTVKVASAAAAAIRDSAGEPTSATEVG